MDGITGTEGVAAQRRLTLLISNKLKRKYSELCGFVRDQMSLAIVRSDTLFLRGAKEKETYIHQRPYLADGVLMALLALWRGQGPRTLESWSDEGQQGQWEMKEDGDKRDQRG